MRTYKINIPLEFEAANDTEMRDMAQEKAQAFTDLNDQLSHDDLLMLVDFITENPDAVQKIKDWIVNPPPIVKTAAKMLGLNK